MEITWTYNWLESIAIFIMAVFGIYLLFCGIVILVTWLAFRPK